MFANNLLKPRSLAAGVLPLAAALLAYAGSAWAEVTVYEKAPSVEELQKKLLGGGQAEQKKYKTRAIVFGDAAAEAPAAPAPVAVPAPPAAVPAASAAAAPSYAPAPAPVPARPPASPAQTVQVSDNAIAFPIQFRVNSSQILPESMPFLQSIAGLMQKEPGVRLLIEGHTDVSGNYQRNLALSRERAYSVMNFLIDRFGLEPMRFMPVGKGPTEPLQGLDPTDAKNRRVQFRIVG